MSFSNFFQISYYFDSYPVAVFSGFWVVLGLTVFVLAASVWLRMKAEKWSYARREITKRITGPLFLSSWLMLLWMFFRFEGIPVMTWRLWPFLLVLFLLISAGRLIYWVRVVLPRKKERASQGDGVKQHYLKRFKNQGRAGGSKKK